MTMHSIIGHKQQTQKASAFLACNSSKDDATSSLAASANVTVPMNQNGGGPAVAPADCGNNYQSIS